MGGTAAKSGSGGSVSEDQGLTIFDREGMIVRVGGGSVSGDRATNVANRVWVEARS